MYITFSAQLHCNGAYCEAKEDYYYDENANELNNQMTMTKIQKAVKKRARNYNWIITREGKAYCPLCAKSHGLRGTKKGS